MAVCKSPNCDEIVPDKHVGQGGSVRHYCSVSCRAAYHYQKSTEQYRQYYRKERSDPLKVQLHRDQARQKLISWKSESIVRFGGRCMDCKGTFPLECFDFDHVRGEKIVAVSRATSQSQRETELDKCDLVCANCHRIRTRNRRYEKVG